MKQEPSEHASSVLEASRSPDRRAAEFERDGYAIIPNLIDARECDDLARRLESDSGAGAGVGTRCLLASGWCQELARRLKATPSLAPYMPFGPVAVQCTYFQKSSGLNWLVPLHQDLSIPVAERIDHASLSGWSRKQSGYYVQPPPETLVGLVAVRLHIDDCSGEDGPLRVTPGSHRLGRIAPSTASEVRRGNGEVVCLVDRGGAVILRPLLLHASSKSTGRGRRRVLHFVFGPPGLPFGLTWNRAV